MRPSLPEPRPEAWGIPESATGPSIRRPFPWINVLLFLATVASTVFVGMGAMVSFEGQEALFADGLVSGLRENPAVLLEGVPFSAALIAILLAHEMGHYLTCRYYGIDASLPYFIPAPTLVGTFGAFIRIRSPIQHRAALLEVGIAGPIAGFIVALPLLAYSMTESLYVPLDSPLVEGGLTLGDPLIFTVFEWLMARQAPDGMETFLHPIGFAAWIGFLVTALNLLPVGQLDGGHVVYALSRRGHWIVSRALVPALALMGYFYWPGWFVWALLLLLIGLGHPPTTDDSLPLARRHVLLGWLGLAMLVLCFTPAPIH